MDLKILFKGFLLSAMSVALCATVNAQSPNSNYKWLSDDDQPNALRSRIAPPDGFNRVPCSDGSFCEWLRDIPLKPDGSPVFYYNGDIKKHAQHYAVLNLDTGKRDLQQCADAVMRLKAEYHYARSEYSKIHFNYTSGHKVSFDDWRLGRKPVVRGNKVSFTEASGGADNSYENFRKYMTRIFTYAGTLSLSKELESVSRKDMRVGDMFILGGSPGHAVLVIDVAENDDGEKKFLLAQSFMPAQDMHILKNPNNVSSPWYSSNFFAFLETPDWQFSSKDLKRFKN